MLNVKIAKADKVLSIDWDAMPENAQRHIIEYGQNLMMPEAARPLRNSVNRPDHRLWPWLRLYLRP
jgi:hypothetical protein